MKYYKIQFPGSHKNWTPDIEIIKKYSSILKRECLNLYQHSEILIKIDDNEPEIFDLHEWLKTV